MAHAGVMRSVLPLQHSFACIENPVAIRIVNDVGEIRDALFLHEVAQDVDVAVRSRVCCKDVVIGNNDDFAAVPYLRVLAELALEHADGAGSAHVMSHEHVGIDPDVIASSYARLASRPRQYFFRQRHSREKITDRTIEFKLEKMVSGARSQVSG